MKRCFIFREGGSQKFWNIELEGSQFEVTYGRLGTEGQKQTKAFESSETAQKEAEKLIKSKLGKGYAEVSETDVQDAKVEGKRFALSTDEDGWMLVGTNDDLMQKILKDKQLAGLKHITIVNWEGCSEGESCQGIIDLLIENSDKLQHIESFSIGEIEPEEYELSWIAQADYSKFWNAFPNLKKLRVQGGNDLQFGVITNHNLEEIEIFCGGIPKDVVDSIAAADLPNLHTLKIYFGVEDYGWDGDIETVKNLLKNKLPALRYLGLLNYVPASTLPEVVIESGLLPQLEVLDFSFGTFADAGAEFLIANMEQFVHLKRLIIEHHYMTEIMEARLKKSGKNLEISDRDEPYDEDDKEEDYYPVYTE